MKNTKIIGNIFILPDIAGGISRVVANLCSEKDIIILCRDQKTILTDTHDAEYFKNVSTILFNYKTLENLDTVCKRLSSLIPNTQYPIIANDWLPLEMASRTGIKNILVYIAHGNYEYYYNLAENYEKSIDIYFGVSEFITQKLRALLPANKNNVHKLTIGVEVEISKPILQVSDILKIVFVGRLTKEKGFLDLSLINHALGEYNQKVQWLICGDQELVKQNIFPYNFEFMGKLANDEVIEVLKSGDIFILPSRAEGFPVSLLEAMKCNLIPLITNLESGIPEIIIEGFNGYLLNLDDINGYANRLIYFINNKGDLIKIKGNVYESIYNKFTIDEQKLSFEIGIKSSKVAQALKSKYHIAGSRLDKSFIPNFIVKSVRKLKKIE